MKREDRLKAPCGALGEKNKRVLLNQDLHIGSDKSLSEPLYGVLFSGHQGLNPPNRESDYCLLHVEIDGLD